MKFPTKDRQSSVKSSLAGEASGNMASEVREVAPLALFCHFNGGFCLCWQVAAPESVCLPPQRYSHRKCYKTAKTQQNTMFQKNKFSQNKNVSRHVEPAPEETESLGFVHSGLLKWCLCVGWLPKRTFGGFRFKRLSLEEILVAPASPALLTLFQSTGHSKLPLHHK